MAKTKNGSRVKKILKIVVAVVLVLTLAQLLVLGILGGIGPFGFIRENKIKNHPGNKPEYDFSQLKAMENSNPFFHQTLHLLLIIIFIKAYNIQYKILSFSMQTSHSCK